MGTKGRRSNRETNMKCAVRFEEETDLTDEEYILLDNVVPLSGLMWDQMVLGINIFTI